MRDQAAREGVFWDFLAGRGPALVATLGPGEWAPMTDLHVQFLAVATAKVRRRLVAADVG